MSLKYNYFRKLNYRAYLSFSSPFPYSTLFKKIKVCDIKGWILVLWNLNLV